MKNMMLLTIAATSMIFSCSQSLNKKAKEEKAHLAESKQEMNDARRIRNDSVRAKTALQWKKFKTHTGRELARLDEDVKKIDSSVVQMNSDKKQKLNADCHQAKMNITKLRDRLNLKNIAFDNDMQTLGDKASQETQAFILNFSNDLGELDQAVKKLFRDNKK